MGNWTKEGFVGKMFKTFCALSDAAFATLGDAEQAALRAELVELWSAHNTATAAGRTTVDAEYLDVVATRAWPGRC